MKNLVISFCLLFNIALSQAQTPQKANRSFKLANNLESKDYLPNTIIVKFKPVSATARSLSSNQVKSLKSGVILSVNQKFAETKNLSSAKTLRNSKADTIGLDRIFEIKLADGNIEQVINELLLDPQIEYAEPSYIHRTNYIPLDPRYAQQSYLNLIQAPQGWDIVKNAAGVIIAIVDSGSEINHQDLATNIYYNAGEMGNGKENNKIDDDNDGFIDNYYGWDLVGASGTAIQPDNDPNVKNSENDHGVHVSGIAGAVTDNNIGVSSISFNSAKLLIVKAGPDNDGTEILKGYEGIKYAADHGANIINCSWGSNGGGSFGQDIINYAVSRGCLIVAAAGNDGNSIPQFPAAYQGVLAIANTQIDDTKAASSNYGSYVSFAAPGTGIMSTVFGGRYDAYTGTSMSAPVVSGAAALVKSAFPALSMQQVGELLRVTADDIDAKNPNFTGDLGRGRLNVRRALTENSPSVRLQRVLNEERKAGLAIAPDTLYLYINIRNLLFPVNNLKVSLSSTSQMVSLNVSQILLGSLATSETSEVGPFKVLIPAGTVSNSLIEFRLDYAANNDTYQDFERFSVVVARDYLDLNTSSISTTVTSNGRVGFEGGSAENGSGFTYQGEQLLFEASLMIGKSSTMVSNNTRSSSGSEDEHFVKKLSARELINNADSTIAESEFDDSNSRLPLNIYAKQRMIVYKQVPNDNFAIVQYDIFNRNNTSLNGIYVGLFTDWDIDGGGTNVTEFNSSSRLGYVYNKQQASKYAGVKLLSKNAQPIYYPLSFNIAGNPLSDENFTIAEKWETLSSGIKAPGLGTTTSGVDVFFVSGNGPYNIPANGSIKVAFALVGANSLQELEEGAQNAEVKYDLIQSAEPQINVEKYAIINYPNPVLGNVNTTNTVEFSLPQESVITLEVYNTLGQRIATLFKDQLYSKGVYARSFSLNDNLFSGIKSGIYFYRLSYSGGAKTSKFSVLR